MKTRLINLWEKLRASYWFLPGLLALGAVLLALLVGTIDRWWGASLADGFSWLGGNEPAGARAFLSTVAGATITVTGVVFSVTIVALSLASQQFGPRLLSSFMRDQASQGVFGVFVATYLYCLLVLRTIRGDGPEGFVPHLSLLVGFALAVFSVGVLIFFVHHVASSIQAMTVIANVSAELEGAIARHFPLPEAAPKGGARRTLQPGDLPEGYPAGARPVAARRSGYLQAVDIEGLLRLASERELLLQMERRPGDFVARGAPLVSAWPPQRSNPEELGEAVNTAFIFGAKRSAEQDIEYLVRQLVEIAVRALSPGVNDPFTALNCIDYLGSALGELARRQSPAAWHFDDDGDLRLITRPRTFEEILAAAVDQVRRYGRQDAEVSLRLLAMLTAVLPHTREENQRRALLGQAAMIERGSRQGLAEEKDRQAVHERYLEFFEILETHFGLSGEGV